MQTPFPIHRQRFPWRGGNHFQLLVDGENFFPAMLASIRGARHYVLLEMYLFESGTIAGEFIAALTASATRGVGVYLLVDDFGAQKLNQADRRSLLAAGVHLTFYNPLRYGKLRRNLWRDHRKLMVVDNQVAYTGGAGITDEFAPGHPLPWHDLMLAVRGPCVGDWHTAFAQLWNHTRGGKVTPLPLKPAVSLPRPDQELGAGHAGKGRVTLNNPVRMEIKRSLLKQLRTAERRIWIASAYFIPSWKIRRRLYQAARRGCDVRLLLPGPHTDHPSVRHAGRRYYHKLLAAGVRIFEYQPRFLHAKLLLCDNWASIGSSNIDRWNFRWNLEANQETADRGLNDQLVALFERNFAQSQEVFSGQWRHRPWYRHLQERFWGRIELWLERFSQGKP
ncbi:phosphatidylserine/phosphatidylglycerophosphate/cardiolipin synthase family protein [Desulfurivibrio sp. D14AmB]|uniref:phospholipase D-like domain-containing protein n=1 Tax=Desulfurivibrio sp. D14AmB TaxID=3374370 RepID=UPI00376EAF6D